jgi:hypothetical protein
MEVPLYTRVVKGPVVSCRPADTCCRWCLVVVEAIVATAMKALASEVPALAGGGRL